MESSSRLRTLIEELAEVMPTRDALEERFSIIKGWIKYGKDRGNLAGELAELRTLMRVETLEQRHPEEVKIYWLGKKMHTKDYRFTPVDNKPNIKIERMGKDIRDKVVGEVDLVMLVRGTPVIIETHLSPYRARAHKKRVGVGRLLTPQMIEQKREPIAVLCGMLPQVAYVVPEDHLRRTKEESSNISLFINRGGIVLSFGEERRDWNVYVDELYALRVA